MAASGPHIPLIQGETVWGAITNITLTLFVFLILVIILAFFAQKALKSEKKSTLKTSILNFLHFFDTYLRDSF